MTSSRTLMIVRTEIYQDGNFTVSKHEWRMFHTYWRRMNFVRDGYNYASCRAGHIVVILACPKELGYVDRQDAISLYNQWRETANYGKKWGEF